MATQQHTASGYQGSGSNLVLSPKVSMLVMQQYKCQSPLERMANWNGDPENNLVCNSKVYYETSQGLVSNDACDDTNGQVTLLHQSFASDFMELCGFEKYTLKKDEAEAIRMCERWMAHQYTLHEDLQHWLNKKTVPYAIATLIASAHPGSRGLGAVGIPASGGGVAAGLGDLNNPIRIDVTSPTTGGSVLQAGAISMGAAIARLKLNMFAQGVLCTTSELMLAGGGGLATALDSSEMCADACTLKGTGMQFTVTPWMFEATNAAGQKVSYLVLFDPKRFWFQMHQLYLKWIPGEHYQALVGATLWGAKVNNPKAVSVLAYTTV